MVNNVVAKGLITMVTEGFVFLPPRPPLLHQDSCAAVAFETFKGIWAQIHLFAFVQFVCQLYLI